MSRTRSWREEWKQYEEARRLEEEQRSRITFGGVVAAAPDLLLAGAFLLAFLFGERAPLTPDILFYTIYIEFFMIFGFGIWIGVRHRHWQPGRKIKAFLGQSLVIVYFLALLWAITRLSWPLLNFALLLLKRVIVLLVDRHKLTDATKQADSRELCAMILFFLLCAILGAGIAGVGSLFGREWQPLYLAGFPYFLCIGLSGIFNHRWLGHVSGG